MKARISKGSGRKSFVLACAELLAFLARKHSYSGRTDSESIRWACRLPFRRILAIVPVAATLDARNMVQRIWVFEDTNEMAQPLARRLRCARGWVLASGHWIAGLRQ